MVELSWRVGWAIDRPGRLLHVVRTRENVLPSKLMFKFIERLSSVPSRQVKVSPAYDLSVRMLVGKFVRSGNNGRPWRVVVDYRHSGPTQLDSIQRRDYNFRCGSRFMR